jgi:hypothetical protein
MEDGSMRYELKGQASMKCLLSLRYEGARVGRRKIEDRIRKYELKVGTEGQTCA